MSLKQALVALLATACARGSIGERGDTAAAAEVAKTSAPPPVIQAPSARSETVSTGAASSVVADSSPPAPLACIPTTFGAGDTLTLQMRTPHGHYLTVSRSDRTAYLIVYPLGKSRPNQSLIPSDAFTRVATLRLPSDVRAVPYVYGRDTILEPVFGESGKYLLRVGDNFGSDYGSEPDTCALTFVRRTSK